MWKTESQRVFRESELSPDTASRSWETTRSSSIRLEICDRPVKAHWYRRLGPDDEAGIVAAHDPPDHLDRSPGHVQDPFRPLRTTSGGDRRDPRKCLDRDSSHPESHPQWPRKEG